MSQKEVLDEVIEKVFRWPAVNHRFPSQSAKIKYLQTADKTVGWRMTEKRQAHRFSLS